MRWAAEPELREVQEQFAAIRDAAHALLDGLTPAQLAWRPRPDRWSILECVEHLRVTGSELYHPKMAEAIRDARANGRMGTGPFRHGLIGRWFARSMEPPPRLRIKTSPALLPPADLDADATLTGFFGLQDRWIELAAEADGLDLAGIRLRSPVAPVLRFSLGDCFAINAAHERRHLWQAARVREDPAFPTTDDRGPRAS